ncbi:MAG TPA: SMP-30/gluconolactonase/LRE family protein [Chitinophagaceae bacterium]|nr:SMP-30/gluconolactonase/LRE family protein [Chitinophagaceae bacterium]
MSKTILQYFFLLTLLYCAACSNTEQSTSTKKGLAYTIPENDAIPEGIAYDPVKKEFYVSSTYKRKIIKIKEDGSYEDFIQEKQDGIYGVVGMRVDAKRRVLWAASGTAGAGMPIKDEDSTITGNSGVFKYDLNTGKLIKKYLLDGDVNRGYFLNDLVVDSNGVVYISDTPNGTIYTIRPEKDVLEIFYTFPGEAYPNGLDLTPDERYLYLTWYARPSDMFGRLEIQTRKLDTVTMANNWQAGSDGLYFYNNSLVAIIPADSSDEVVQYMLDSTFLHVHDRNMLAKSDSLFSQPTTGVIVGNKLYYVASSNLQLFRRLYEQTKGNVNLKDLAPIRVGVLELKTQ